jgi:hypothetical protein
MADYVVYYKNQKTLGTKKLVTLSMAASDYKKYLNNAGRKNEITVEQKMYDVASVKFQNGNVILKCFEDKDDLMLLSFLSKKSVDDASSSKSKNSKNFHSLQLFANDISQCDFSFSPINEKEINFIPSCYSMYRAAPVALPPCA